MTDNPFVNALAATTYIIVVASAVFYGPHGNDADSGIIVPVAVLSLFVLSAAMMGYFFLYRPLLLLSEGRKQEASKLFLSTVAVFACITVVLFGALMLIGTLFS